MTEKGPGETEEQPEKREPGEPKHHEDPCFLPMPSLLASLRNALGERCRGSGDAAPEEGEARDCDGEGEEVAAEEEG